MTLEEKIARLKDLRAEIAALDAEVGLEAERAEYARLGLPTEPGWYLDAGGNPARLTEDGFWDDGWGNGGEGYGYPVPPLRRMHVEDAEVMEPPC